MALTLACFVVSKTAFAQFAPTPCDPEYMESLESRAWLEAQREITQNQNLIFKPDSVLEYMCFDNHLGELAEHAADMFSETDRWGAAILANQDTHMDAALIALVMGALDAYDTANFNHRLLGGRVRAASDWIAPPGAPTVPNVVNYVYNALDPPTAANASIAGTYACDVMQAVWQKAKCLNFIDSAGNDGFFTLENYSTNVDRRWLPRRCPGVQADWVANIDTAYRNTPWTEDDVDTYLDHLLPPAGCGTGNTNRVRTGLVVSNPNHAAGDPLFYNEYVCVVPGCYWDPSGTGTAASPSDTGTCTPAVP